MSQSDDFVAGYRAGLEQAHVSVLELAEKARFANFEAEGDAIESAAWHLASITDALVEKEAQS